MNPYTVSSLRSGSVLSMSFRMLSGVKLASALMCILSAPSSLCRILATCEEDVNTDLHLRLAESTNIFWDKDLANSSAFSLPSNPSWSGIHINNTLFIESIWLRLLSNSKRVLSQSQMNSNVLISVSSFKDNSRTMACISDCLVYFVQNIPNT